MPRLASRPAAFLRLDQSGAGAWDWTYMRVPRTKVPRKPADIKAMISSRQLKSQIETGQYKPQPALVAAAMLQHRGVRSLLIRENLAVLSAADRNQQAPLAPRRAA